MLKDFLFLMFIPTYIFLQIKLIKVDVLFAFAFFYLFIYIIFALTGYFYFPSVSGLIDAYFGYQIDLNAILFVIFSFIFTFFLLNIASKILEKQQPLFRISTANFNYPAFALPLFAFLSIFQYWGLLHFEDAISYSNSSDPDFISQSGVVYTTWVTLFKLSPTSLVVFYSVIRYQLWDHKISRLLAQCVLFFSLFIFLLVSKKLGNRLDSIALLNGFVMVELIRRNSQKTRLITFSIRLLFAAGLMLAFMMWVKTTRLGDSDLPSSWSELILLQDYFAPAHMLFAAMAKNLINPIEVLCSNFYNSLVLMNYPLLQQYVTDTFNPGITTRTQSYAFYILTEGYLVMGLWGFIYNGVVISAGLYFWRRLASTTSSNMTAFLLPILALDTTTLARGQSAYFIKVIYFHFIPALFFIYICTGNYIRGAIISYRRI